MNSDYAHIRKKSNSTFDIKIFQIERVWCQIDILCCPGMSLGDCSSVQRTDLSYQMIHNIYTIQTHKKCRQRLRHIQEKCRYFEMNVSEDRVFVSQTGFCKRRKTIFGVYIFRF